jgi:hypothetical protein
MRKTITKLSISTHGELPPFIPFNAPTGAGPAFPRGVTIQRSQRTQSGTSRDVIRIPAHVHIVTFMIPGQVSYLSQEALLRYYNYLYGDEFMNFFLAVLSAYRGNLGTIISTSTDKRNLYSAFYREYLKFTNNTLNSFDISRYSQAVEHIITDTLLDGEQTINMSSHEFLSDIRSLKGYVYNYKLGNTARDCFTIGFTINPVTGKPTRSSCGIKGGVCRNDIITNPSSAELHIKMGISDIRDNQYLYNDSLSNSLLIPRFQRGQNNGSGPKNLNELLDFLSIYNPTETTPLYIFLNCCKSSRECEMQTGVERRQYIFSMRMSRKVKKSIRKSTRKVKKSIRKSPKKSIRKSIRKSPRKVKKSIRKSIRKSPRKVKKSIRKSIRKSPRKVRKSIRKSIRKLKK